MINPFEFCTVGGIHFKNHLLRAATNDYSETTDGKITEEQINLHRKLAESGVGGVITANYYVQEEGKLDIWQNSISEDWDEDGLTRLCDILRSYEVPVIIQISHAGEKSKVNPEIASGYSDLNHLNAADLMKIAGAFIKAASRVKKAGADAVQIHCGHGYLLSQILLPGKNMRNDIYGGSTWNRYRILEDIMQGIHKTCGLSYPVWTKINCNDFETEEFMELCMYMKSSGVAAIECSGNNFMKIPIGVKNYYQEQAELIRKRIKIPVLLTGGIRELKDVYEAMKAGIDMVALSRPFICQPDLIGHWKSGEASSCRSCNQCFTLYTKTGKRCILHS